ncbi:hypothetical protein [Streptomyces sp. NRRL S-646]|uniref:hypothetical protein n=1 Tax=Streptomyces sp. NRRL S-646 TaxID=1463917 RepID=UPI001331771A|nr:hypothetical protein [Streptomyces sp. NRRL S-646]
MIPAGAAVAGVRATVRAFLDVHLRGGRPETSHVLTGASPRHPDIRCVAGRAPGTMSLRMSAVAEQPYQVDP